MATIAFADTITVRIKVAKIHCVFVIHGVNEIYKPSGPLVAPSLNMCAIASGLWIYKFCRFLSVSVYVTIIYNG